MRIIELEENQGCQITIDGQDIAKMGLHYLRKSICIIPQDPFLLNGTIRLNVDPFNQHEDATLTEILQDLEFFKTLNQDSVNTFLKNSKPKNAQKGSKTAE